MTLQETQRRCYSRLQFFVLECRPIPSMSDSTSVAEVTELRRTWIAKPPALSMPSSLSTYALIMC